MALLQSIRDGLFSLTIEFTPTGRDDVRRIARIAASFPDLNRKLAAHRMAIAAVTLTQNPGGSKSYDPLAALAILREEGLPAGIEVLPHVTGKDMNADALAVLLRALAESGVETVLALTGDLPAGRGVFDLDSPGLLRLVRETNAALLRSARSVEDLAARPQLAAGAAVSPFKYTPGSLAMQLIKAAKKIREGAAFLVCQAGWDAERSERLIGELCHEPVPLLGNALVVVEAAARHMQTLPGCVVTDAFLASLRGEGEPESRLRAARQIAMFRGLGYAGADLGKPGEFQSADEIAEILETAAGIADWQEHRAALSFPPDEPAPAKATGSARASWAIHGAVFEEDGALHGVARALLRPFNNSAQREGALYRLFKCMEDSGKEALYRCEHCGDCFLPENEYLCTMGQCEKGLANPPCGDARPDGRCGNNPECLCVGEKLYHRMMRRGTLEAFRAITLPPRRAALRETSSILNRFFGRDHHTRPDPLAGSGLIQVAELIHASVPLAGAALAFIRREGDAGFDRPNRGLTVIEDLIRTQALEGATYIDLNLDALGAPDAPARMRRLVRMVRDHGGGTPPCIDSSDPAVLEAGLDEWLSFGPDVRPALVNSVTLLETDRYAPILARRRERPFGVVGLLIGAEGPLRTTDDMVGGARQLYARLAAAGFLPGDVFFDTVTLGIATDGFLDAEGNLKSSHTRNAFAAIRRIRDDEEMRGVHALLGVSNWVYGARKRRIGHLRAFVQVAMEYGLDAIIADTSKRFGRRDAPPELVEFVRMYAALDGSEASMELYEQGVGRARANGWV